MNLKELTETVNNLFYNNSSSYKTITSKQKELLVIIGASIDINNITDKVVNKYYKKLISLGNKPATINSKMMYLSKCLNYALRTKLIKYKPFIPTMKVIANKDVFLTTEDIKLMTDYTLKTNQKELYQVIVIGYNTGIRISNIISIRPDDIEDNYIRIYHNKTNNPYSVPMNETIKELMKDFKEFTLNYRQLEYRFKTMIKELNLDDRITIHTLRHSTCSKLVKEGIPLPVVQALMNHKNISTTMRYNHLRNEQLEQAVSVL